MYDMTEVGWTRAVGRGVNVCVCVSGFYTSECCSSGPERVDGASPLQSCKQQLLSFSFFSCVYFVIYLEGFL